MNEIKVRPDAPRSRQVVTASVVLVFALLLGLVAVLAGRGRPGPSALVPLPASADSGVGGPGVGGPGAAADSAVAVSGPDSYQVQGALPVLAGHAKAYRLDRPVTGAEVLRLARALGLTTAVEADQSGWSVAEGSQRLEVTREGGGQWYYTSNGGTSCIGIAAVRGGKGGITCKALRSDIGQAAGSGQATTSSGQATAGSGQATTSGGQASVGSQVGTDPSAPSARAQAGPPSDPAVIPAPTAQAAAVPSPPARCLRPTCPNGAMCVDDCLPEPRPVADLLSSQDALKQARDVLRRAGVDLAGAAVKVSSEPTAEVITVDPAVAGMPTVGMATSLALGAKGRIEFGQGLLAGPSELGDYPLVGTKAGFERLLAGSWLFGGGIRPLGIAQGAGPATVTGGSRPTASGHAVGGQLPAPGVPEPAQRLPVKVTGVHLALVKVFGGDQRSYLEPAYVFETAEMWPVSPVPAVTDGLLRQIAPAPGPQPSPKPVPVPAPAPAPGAPTAAGGAG